MIPPLRAFVGITDFAWYQLLSERPDIDELKFWQPSASSGGFKALAPGELFLFKLHSPRDYIVGGGLEVPVLQADRPSPAFLQWHAENVYRG